MTERSGTEKLEKITVFKQYSSCSPTKIRKVMRLISSIVQRGETFILFADYVESANLIKTVIKHNFPRLRVRFVERRMSSDERMNIFSKLGKSYNGLVFAKLGGEGIDIPAIDNVIMLNPSKSPILFSQRTGRAMRPFRDKKYCKIYSFVLSGSWEEGWSEYSFREYLHEGFVNKPIEI